MTNEMVLEYIKEHALDEDFYEPLETLIAELFNPNEIYGPTTLMECLETL